MQNGLARVIFCDDSIRNLTKRLQKNYQLVRIVVDMRLYGEIFQSAAAAAFVKTSARQVGAPRRAEDRGQILDCRFEITDYSIAAG